jgi:phosphohistidine phosphatase
MRHAKSAWAKPALEDFERPLAARGRRAAAVMGAYMADERLIPDLVLCSAARRARQTWLRIAAAFAHRPRTRYEHNLYLAAPEDLLTRLHQLPDAVRSILMIGHEGGVDRVALLLTGSGDPQLRSRMGAKFPTGALAVIDIPAKHWTALKEGDGTLLRFVSPKELV